MPAKSTRKAPGGNARKPRPDFPLFPHATGRWAKKIHQKLRYFGKVAGDEKGQAALEKWLEQKDDLLAGREPRPKVNGVTIRELANRYLSAKRDHLAAGEITTRTFGELHAACQQLGAALGWDRLVVDLVTGDFERLRRQFAKRWGPSRLGVEIQRVRSILKYGFDSGMIDQAIRYGSGFQKPNRRVMREQRAKAGTRMFEAADLRAIIAAAPMPLKAMILLGVNCGFGNHDCATLPQKALDLDSGWVDFPRPKTAIPRRCPLWPQTIAAVRAAIANRPTPKDKGDAGLAFIAPRGGRWYSESGTTEESGWVDRVGNEFSALLRELGLHRPGLGFYALRHTFETIGGDSRDQVAVDYVMGHARCDMASVYRERIDDARLVAVVEHVRKWLFGENETK
jgi:integrase